MSPPTCYADNVVIENRHPPQDAARAELISGLRLPQKRIDPKFFYDVRGSELFDQITRQPEYYITRTESRILSKNAQEIAHFCGQGSVLIEPGSGNSAKVRLLLDALQPAIYIPMDISSSVLYHAAIDIGREFPWLTVHAINADFSNRNQGRTGLPQGRRVVFYPGSTIGNMEPEQAQDFLSELREWIGSNGGILIGVDLHKSEIWLNPAYNDQAGVTAKFNLNILNVVNSLIDANFNWENYSHRAFYNRALQRIEMHLVSRNSHRVDVGETTIEMLKGETLHTENSYKYTLDGFTELGRAAGFTPQRTWLDADRLFSVHFLSADPRG